MKINVLELQQPASLELLAGQMVEGFITGLHKSPYHGFSVEFAEHRVYNEGESTRHLDWRVFARTDRLYIKRYEEETNLRCLIAIDHSASMYYPEGSNAKLKFSVYAAAGLANLLQKQRDAVGICLFSNKIETLTPIKSTPTHLDKIYIQLSKFLTSERPTSATAQSSQIADVLHEIAEKIHKRSLVIIFSDMFDAADNTQGLFNALQHLKHNRHEVIVFHVMDNETELHFNFEDRPMEFVDLETGNKLNLNPYEIKKVYQNKATQFHQTLKMRCHQYKIDFVEVDIRSDFNTILQTYLIKRARLK